MIIKGDYGTIFECDDFSQANEPVQVTTTAGSFDVPTSDLAVYYLERCRIMNEKPVDITATAKKYLHLAIEASVEHLKEINKNLSKENKRLREAVTV